MTNRFFRSIRVTALVAVCAAVPTLAAAQASSRSSLMSGTWNVSMIGDHVIPAALVLEQDGALLKGTLMMMGKEIPMTGEVTGSAFAISGKAAVAFQQHSSVPSAGVAPAAPPAAPNTALKFTGTITDDGTLEGQFALPNGAMKFTAERLRSRPVSSGQPVVAGSVAGDWTMTLAVEPDPVVGTLALQQSGATLTGTYTSEHLGAMRIAGTQANGKLLFTADGQAHGQDVHLEFTGVLKADGSLAGDLTSQMGSMTWTALRLKK